MKIIFKNLVDVSFGELHKTFNNAFTDYAVDVSYMSAEVMRKRAIKNGYDPTLSVGIFDENKLVGFTLVGIDYHYYKPAAFDIMTGMVKEYRGKGYASKMFHFIKPKLQEKNIEVFYLEVLQENNSAIRAYQKAGFKIIRKLDCFSLNIRNFQTIEKVRIPLLFKYADKYKINAYETYADWTPSWENSFQSIKRIPDELLIIEAEYSIHKVGLVVYYPTLNWIMTLLVDPKFRRMGVGSTLMKKLIDEINGKSDNVKFLNIQSEDEDLIGFLKASGFTLLTGQFEMKYDLN
jgi:ribosomal protein S18 acetylase RimI-like enzyme